MKQFFIYIVLIFLFLNSCVRKEHYTIQTNSSNIFYKGVQNPLLITGKNTHKIEVLINNGVITKEFVKKDTARYSIVVWDSITTKIIIKFNNRNLEYTFRNKNIPDPYLTVSLSNPIGLSNETTVKNFKTFKRVNAQLINFDYNCSFRVIKYTMVQIKNNGKVTSFEWNDKDFNYTPNKFTKLAELAESGDIFIFSNCQVEFLETNEIRSLRDYIVRIK